MAVDDQMKFLRLIELYGSEKIILGADQKMERLLLMLGEKNPHTI